MTMERIDYASVQLGGKDYVILSSKEYDRLTSLVAMPPLPEPDAAGNYPAIEYVSASIARSVIRERIALNLTRHELAKLAGVRVETLFRIETGKHTASTGAIAKLDRALKTAATAKSARARSPKAPKRRSRTS